VPFGKAERLLVAEVATSSDLELLELRDIAIRLPPAAPCLADVTEHDRRQP
jgi:hypothetical protein